MRRIKLKMSVIGRVPESLSFGRKLVIVGSEQACRIEEHKSAVPICKCVHTVKSIGAYYASPDAKKTCPTCCGHAVSPIAEMAYASIKQTTHEKCAVCQLHSETSSKNRTELFCGIVARALCSDRTLKIGLPPKQQPTSKNIPDEEESAKKSVDMITEYDERKMENPSYYRGLDMRSKLYKTLDEETTHLSEILMKQNWLFGDESLFDLIMPLYRYTILYHILDAYPLARKYFTISRHFDRFKRTMFNFFLSTSILDADDEWRITFFRMLRYYDRGFLDRGTSDANLKSITNWDEMTNKMNERWLIDDYSILPCVIVALPWTYMFPTEKKIDIRMITKLLNAVPISGKGGSERIFENMIQAAYYAKNGRVLVGLFQFMDAIMYVLKAGGSSTHEPQLLKDMKNMPDVANRFKKVFAAAFLSTARYSSIHPIFDGENGDAFDSALLKKIGPLIEKWTEPILYPVEYIESIVRRIHNYMDDGFPDKAMKAHAVLQYMSTIHMREELEYNDSIESEDILYYVIAIESSLPSAQRHLT